MKVAVSFSMGDAQGGLDEAAARGAAAVPAPPCQPACEECEVDDESCGTADAGEWNKENALQEEERSEPLLEQAARTP